MGSVVKSVGGALGLGGAQPGEFKGKDYKINKDAFGKISNGVQDKTLDLYENQKQSLEGIDQRQFRDKQTSLASALEAQAAGQGPSVAAQQLKSATDRSLAQQMALAASRPGGTASSARQLLRNQAEANAALGRNAAELRMQEQQSAQKQLSDVLNASRQQDIGAQQAGAQNQLASLGLVNQIAQANRDAKMQYEQMMMNQALGVSGQRQQAAAAQAQSNAAITGGLLGGVGAWMASDEKLKTDVKSGRQQTGEFLKAFADGIGEAKNDPYEKLQEGVKSLVAGVSDKDKKKDVKDGDTVSKNFLSALEAKTYKYKDKSLGEGKHLSVMAQDLEKAGPIGESMVEDTPMGKIVDYGKGFGAILAAQAELHKRLEAIEKKKKD